MCIIGKKYDFLSFVHIDLIFLRVFFNNFHNYSYRNGQEDTNNYFDINALHSFQTVCIVLFYIVSLRCAFIGAIYRGPFY